MRLITPVGILLVAFFAYTLMAVYSAHKGYFGDAIWASLAAVLSLVGAFGMSKI